MERMFSRADLRKLLVPLMVEQALAMTIGMADTVMVASCSEAAVSGVSLIDSVNAVFLWLFPALATGGGVVLAQYIGRGEEENARRSVGQLTLLLVGFSMMISVLFMLFRDELLVLLFGQIEPQVMAYARTYFTVSIISYPFLALYNVGASVFRAVGNSKLSMTVSTVANALNLIGNAILIYGFGLEVLGAGLPAFWVLLLCSISCCGRTAGWGCVPLATCGFKRRCSDGSCVSASPAGWRARPLTLVSCWWQVWFPRW